LPLPTIFRLAKIRNRNQFCHRCLSCDSFIQRFTVYFAYCFNNRIFSSTLSCPVFGKKMAEL